MGVGVLPHPKLLGVQTCNLARLNTILSECHKGVRDVITEDKFLVAIS